MDGWNGERVDAFGWMSGWTDGSLYGCKNELVCITIVPNVGIVLITFDLLVKINVQCECVRMNVNKCYYQSRYCKQELI